MPPGIPTHVILQESFRASDRNCLSVMDLRAARLSVAWLKDTFCTPEYYYGLNSPVSTHSLLRIDHQSMANPFRTYS